MKIRFVLLAIFLILGFNVALAKASQEFELEQEHYEEEESSKQENATTADDLSSMVQIKAVKKPTIILRTPHEIKLSTPVVTNEQKPKNDLNDEDFEREDYAHEPEETPVKNNDRMEKSLASDQLDSQDNFLSGFYIRFGLGYQKGINPNELPPFKISDYQGPFPLNSDLSNTPNYINFAVFSANQDVLNPLNTTVPYPQTYNSVSNIESSWMIGGSVGYKLNDAIDLEVLSDTYHYSSISTAPLAVAFLNEFVSVFPNGYWGMSVKLSRTHTMDINTYMLGANLKLPIDSSFKPFLIGGVGFAKLRETQNTYITHIAACNQVGGTLGDNLSGCVNDLVNGSDQQTRNYFASNVTMTKRLPIYQVGAGLEYDFNKNFAADIRYKYTRSHGKTPITNVTLQNHNFTFGLKYKF